MTRRRLGRPVRRGRPKLGISLAALTGGGGAVPLLSVANRAGIGDDYLLSASAVPAIPGGIDYTVILGFDCSTMNGNLVQATFSTANGGASLALVSTTAPDRVRGAACGRVLDQSDAGYADFTSTGPLFVAARVRPSSTSLVTQFFGGGTAIGAVAAPFVNAYTGAHDVLNLFDSHAGSFAFGIFAGDLDNTACAARFSSLSDLADSGLSEGDLMFSPGYRVAAGGAITTGTLEPIYSPAYETFATGIDLSVQAGAARMVAS